MRFLRPTGTSKKYGNVKTEIDGLIFDSKGEAKRYAELKLLARAGEITGLVCQPCYELQPAFRDRQGKHHRAITYKGDFFYQRGEEKVVEDVKAMASDDFKLKQKLFQYRYPEIVFVLTNIKSTTRRR